MTTPVIPDTDIRVFSPAKINLALHVTGKRDDGYHTLDSLVAFASIGDEIVITAADEFSFEIEGPFSASLDTTDQNNLVRVAAQSISQRFDLDLSIKITLTKNLPVSSGMGGGSGNAAATIYGLEKYYNLNIPDDVRTDILCTLGADVPVCYHGITDGGLARMEGIGEILTPITSKQPLACLFVNPNQSCGTADVFKAMTAEQYSGTLPQTQDRFDLVNFIQNTHNSLHIAACHLIPDIQTSLDNIAVIPHCEVARMTGSGATCFGVFSEIKHAQNAANIIQAAHPSWWVKPCFLNS